MFEDLVRDVSHYWDEDGLLHLEFVLTASSILVRTVLGRADIGALSIFMKQKHPLPPVEIAKGIVERWNRNNDLAETSWIEKLAELERRIEAALEAERTRPRKET